MATALQEDRLDDAVKDAEEIELQVCKSVRRFQHELTTRLTRAPSTIFSQAAVDQTLQLQAAPRLLQQMALYLSLDQL